MKIIGQLAEWLLHTDRISWEQYHEIRNRILGEPLWECAASVGCLEDEKAEREEAENDWWNLHGAGIRHGLKEAGRRKGGRQKMPNRKSVKVWELEPRLPEILMGDETAFKLPLLLWPVAEAAGRRFSHDWRGFADCVAFLYGLGAERLHDSLRAAVIKNNRKIPPLLIALEEGDLLFPAHFLSDYAGRSVSIIRKRIAGEAEALIHGKMNWILKYSNFNTINEACLVRNRLHRIFRLWVKQGATRHHDCRLTPGHVCLHLNFGERVVYFPLRVNQDAMIQGLWCATDVPWKYHTKRGEVIIEDEGAGPVIPKDTRGDLVIPSVLKGCSVTSIGDHAFDGCTSLTSVAIPSSITSIGDHAFEDCGNLTSIMIPSSVTSIGDGAFSYCCRLTSLTIPSSVTSIGECAFYGCRLLTSVVIPSGVASISAGAFSNCSGLKSVVISKGVTSIGDEAFFECDNLTTVTVPLGVTSIGDHAFSCCSGLECGLESVVISESVTSIGYCAFSYCHKLESVTIPSSVTNIGDGAFVGCDNLKTVYVDSGDRERMRKLLKTANVAVDSIDIVER